MKTKNPLYVVKGKTVLEAHGIWDLLVKKLNLSPVIEVFSKLLFMLLDQVKDYPTLVAVKKSFEIILGKIQELLVNFKRA